MRELPLQVLYVDALGAEVRFQRQFDRVGMQMIEHKIVMQPRLGFIKTGGSHGCSVEILG